MSADGDSPPERPPPTRPSQAWRDEQAAKRRAYAEQRRRYTAAWHRQLAGLGDEPETGSGESAGAPPQHGRARKPRAGGKVHDPRQGSFEV